MKIEPISQVLITDDFSGAVEKIKEVAPKNSSFELFIKEDENFKVSDANEVIAKAYLASTNKVFLCLACEQFSEVVQNRLLKIIEEPPKNKEFILITPSKATLLPTIKSRLPITILKNQSSNLDLNLNIKNLSLEDVYKFVQEHKRLKPKEAMPIAEAIIKEAIKSNSYNLDANSLELFSNATKALNLGSPADFILTTTLLKLLAKKKKRLNSETISNS